MLLRFLNRTVEDPGTFEKFRTDIDKCLFCSYGIGSDHHPLNQLVRVFVHNLTVLKSTGLGLIRIAD